MCLKDLVEKKRKTRSSWLRGGEGKRGEGGGGGWWLGHKQTITQTKLNMKQRPVDGYHRDLHLEVTFHVTGI